jgi:hypothetical protein
MKKGCFAVVSAVASMAFILFISGCGVTWLPDGGKVHVNMSSDLDFSPSDKKFEYDFSDEDLVTQPSEE